MLHSSQPDPVPSAVAAKSVLRLEAVARRFGQRWVLRGIDLTAGPGSVHALTGRNGSGKTTLLRIAGTLLRATRGTVTVFGHDAAAAPQEIRPHVGMLGHRSGLYDDLTAAENLEFSVRMAGRAADARAIAAALERVALTGMSGERVRGFSAGMRRRVGLARLLLRPPRLLLLDEPYTSFDTDGIELVNDFIAATAAAGGVVLLATHDVAPGAHLVTRRVHIAAGLISLHADDEVLVS